MENEFLNKIAEKCVAKFQDKIEAMVLFGSRAKGNYSDESDFDICIVGNLTLDEKSKIALYFPEEVDVSFFQELPPWIQIRVFGEGKFIFVKDLDKIYKIHSEVLRNYEDLRYFLNKKMIKRFGKCLT